MAECIKLYPFEFFDLLRRRWIRARYVAELRSIIERDEPFRIIGPPEIREGGDGLTAGHLARGPKR